MITCLSKINIGSVFFLPEYPGNSYRKTDSNGGAEFVISRVSNTFVGIQLQMGTYRTVATEPGDRLEEEELDLALL